MHAQVGLLRMQNGGGRDKTFTAKNDFGEKEKIERASKLQNTISA